MFATVYDVVLWIIATTSTGILFTAVRHVFIACVAAAIVARALGVGVGVVGILILIIVSAFFRPRILTPTISGFVRRLVVQAVVRSAASTPNRLVTVRIIMACSRAPSNTLSPTS